MYSVIIQNKKTMESFGQFHPLFSETLEKGEVGICQWMEAGTTVEDALPELINLVEGKESWRAVIVRVQDEEDMAVHPAARMNPYDFYENADGDGKIRENPVPLVRLTHMLGGIPVPETRFEARIVESDRMNPKVIYEPVTDPEEMVAHEKLSEKYRLKTKMPEEILLVTLCTHPKDRDDYLRNVWENRKEQESSEFWKRNQYPGSCRFLYCEETKEGEVRRTGDLFYFWTAVLLLASNSINPNTLQAYRLHRMSVEFDKEEMARIMQESADRAERAIRFIKDSIRRELEKTQHTESQIPDYRLDSPVELHMPEKKNFYVSTADFGLFSRRESSDMAQWKERQMLSERGVASTLIRAERALDQSADRVRRFSEYPSEDIKPLNEYSKLDFQEELDNLFDDIFVQRNSLPGSGDGDKIRQAELDKKVKDTITHRVTGKRALCLLGIAAVLSFLCTLPALVQLLKQGWGSLPGMLFEFGICVAVFVGIEVLILLLRKGALRAAIGDYNRFVHGIVVHICENASTYSRYMSGIMSYMRGNSYLNQTKKKLFLKDEARYYKENHILALKNYREDVKRWSEALYLPVSMNTSATDDNLYIDVQIPPYSNPLYTFENGESYEIPVNNTGDMVNAPFGFIRRLTIVREELYDDAS